MKFLLLLSIFIIPIYSLVYAQNDSIILHQLAKDVTATIDFPKNFSSKLSTQLIFFALPTRLGQLHPVKKKRYFAQPLPKDYSSILLVLNSSAGLTNGCVNQ